MSMLEYPGKKVTTLCMPPRKPGGFTDDEVGAFRKAAGEGCQKPGAKSPDEVREMMSEREKLINDPRHQKAMTLEALRIAVN